MQTPGSTSPKAHTFPIVAIGASAGGLEAFIQLLRALPNSTGMAFVFIQHLDPKHHSILPELLGKAASMPVVEAKNKIKVEPNHVYVIPPNVNMGILQGRLQLTPRATEAGLHAPIDFFMRSLAEAGNNRSIGVVLSGTASDGTRGLAAIKEEGGITFAQDEKSAKFDGMPHSAIASGCVDFILPPAKIGQELARMSGHRYLRHDFVESREAGVKKQKPRDDNFENVFALLQSTCGANFRGYKPGTLERRTLRRMALHKLDSLEDYATFLAKNPSETEALCQDLLIPVTSFFRDGKTFEALKSKVFPRIVKDKTNKGTLRIWTPGCSTGEETYSLAITLLEFLGDRASSFQIQLFGTDANERGIEKARAGVYQERISQGISPERLRRFFTKQDGGYRVSKGVRDLCVFARQNLAEDPPFSQMNLVSCRNLLIYLGPELQGKVMAVLHYALRPSGFLLLGSAESAVAFPDLFDPMDQKHKIFVKRAVTTRLHYDFSGSRYPREVSIPTARSEGIRISTDLDRQHEADRIVLAKYAPPGVIINENMEILQFRGAIGRYIDPAPGRASLHLLKLAKREFVAELRTAVNQAKTKPVLVKRQSVEFRRNGQLQAVNISVEPLASSENHEYLILFEPASPSISAPRKVSGKLQGADRTTKEEISQLRLKLASAEEHLRSVIESKEASDEAYQSANEEILSANEELQSTNEELETSKEELQSANEELNTVNDELHNRNIDLDRVNSDLNNVLASTSLPVVMVDRGLCIRRMTAASAKVLKVLPSDIGRPLTDIRSDIVVPNLDGLIAGVIDTLAPQELEVQDKENHWYSLEIQPYRTTDNKIDGAVLVLSDIDARKRLTERLQKSKEFTEDILDTVREPLVVLALDLKVQYVNPSFLKSFRVNRWETEGKLLYDLGNEQWNIPKLRKALEKVISQDRPLLDFEVEHDFPGLGMKTMLLNASRILDGHSDTPLMLLAIEDVTVRKQAEVALREGEERYRILFDLGPIAVYSCDASGVIRDFNRRAAELWGREPKPGDTDERWCGSYKMLRPDGSIVPHEQCPMAEVLSGTIPEAHDREVQIERPDGSRVTVIVNIRPLTNERGEILGAINCFVDITERKQAEEARARLAAIVESSEDAMISKTLEGRITSWNRGAERLFGYTAEEAIGEEITLIIPPERLPEEASILDRLSRGEPIEHFETQRIRKDGTALDISLTISPVRDSAGRVIGASKVARDITERKVAEMALHEAYGRLESTVEQRTVSVRQLSLMLLTVQDEEHRRISRELHDSVGQDLAMIKVSVDQLPQVKSPSQQTEILSQLSESLDKCMSEIRTISYLLHPPMIDEVGFAAAAQWYIEGFAERSGITVAHELSNDAKRLPHSVELPLFRILQASLSNVHRHADSPSVDVRFAVDAEEAQLEVKDYGKGIDPELLGRFNRSGTGAGIGLAGMRERLREMGGRLEIESDANGTLIRAVIPLSESTDAEHSANAG